VAGTAVADTKTVCGVTGRSEGGALPVFRARRHVLNTATVSATAIRVTDTVVAGPSTCGARLNPFGPQRSFSSDRHRIHGAEQPLDLTRLVQQDRLARIIAELLGGHEEAVPVPICIIDRVEFIARSASHSTYQVVDAAFPIRKVDALRSS